MTRTAISLFNITVFAVLISNNSLAQGIDLSGTWHGGLGQTDKTWVFDMTLTLVQTDNVLAGTSKILAKNGTGAYAIHNITGEVHGATIVLTDQTIKEEDNLKGSWSWCKKVYVGTVTMDKNKLTLKGDWRNDGDLYFHNKQLLENSAFTCYPGNFKVDMLRIQTQNTRRDSLVAKPAPPKPELRSIKDTSGIKKSEPVIKAMPSMKSDSVFLNRTVDIKNVYEVGTNSITLKFYDNGQIDNDTISVYYNRVLILNHQRLSEKAIEVEVEMLPGKDNELLMFADNLGSIPPNTALLIFYDGQRKKEITIDSNTMKSGAVVLRRRNL